MVDDEEGGGKQEMVYDVIAQEGQRGERGEEDGKRKRAEAEKPGLEEKKGRRGSGIQRRRSAGRCCRYGRRGANRGTSAGSVGITWTVLSQWQGESNGGNAPNHYSARAAVDKAVMTGVLRYC